MVPAAQVSTAEALERARSVVGAARANVDALEAVEEITEGKLAGVVIEAAGEIETINLAPQLVQIGGNLLFFGVPRAADFDFDFWKLCSLKV